MGAHLAASLDSVLAQEHTDLDIICIDDGSTDDTRAVLEHYAGRSAGRIRVHHQENRGAGAARNEGVRRSTGEWIQFLDADDALAPRKIASQIALAANAPADLVVGDYEKVMPDGLLLPVEALYDQPWMGLVCTRLGTTSANLWRREAVERAGGWGEALGSSQDYDLMFRMLQGGAKVLFDRAIGTSVLKRPSGSISLTEPKANWERYIALRRAMRDHLAGYDRATFAREIAALDQYIFMALRVLARHDLERAIAEHAEAIPKGFVPEESRATTRRYIRLYKLLGFAGAERSVRMMKKRTTS